MENDKYEARLSDIDESERKVRVASYAICLIITSMTAINSNVICLNCQVRLVQVRFFIEPNLTNQISDARTYHIHSNAVPKMT